MSFVDILESFFTYLAARIDSLINIVTGQVGINAFAVYVWYSCIPSEIRYIVFLFLACVLFYAFIHRSK